MGVALYLRFLGQHAARDLNPDPLQGSVDGRGIGADILSKLVESLLDLLTCLVRPSLQLALEVGVDPLRHFLADALRIPLGRYLEGHGRLEHAVLHKSHPLAEAELNRLPNQLLGCLNGPHNPPLVLLQLLEPGLHLANPLLKGREIGLHGGGRKAMAWRASSTACAAWASGRSRATLPRSRARNRSRALSSSGRRERSMAAKSPCSTGPERRLGADKEHAFPTQITAIDPSKRTQTLFGHCREVAGVHGGVVGVVDHAGHTD